MPAKCNFAKKKKCRNEKKNLKAAEKSMGQPPHVVVEVAGQQETLGQHLCAITKGQNQRQQCGGHHNFHSASSEKRKNKKEEKSGTSSISNGQVIAGNGGK